MKNKKSNESYETIDKILSSRIKSKNIFASFSSEWKRLFLRYNICQGNPCKVIPSINATNIKNELIKIYESPPRQLGEIFKLWRENHDFKCCPYCGDVSNLPTLDHFLPKDFFPEFSILLNNLVPCCAKCQYKKSNKYITNGRRLFYHPLFQFDEIKLSKYIKITIIEENLLDDERIFTPSVNIENNSPIVLKMHFYELGIKDRLRDFCNKEIRRYKKLAKISNNIEELIYMDLYKFSKLKEDRNHWDRIFCIALLKNQDFLDYLKDYK